MTTSEILQPIAYPLKQIDKWLVAILGTLLILIIRHFRRRILFLLTGDEYFRCEILSCCNNSTVDRIFGCSSNRCGMRDLGRRLGLWPYRIRISDLVVGNVRLGFMGEKDVTCARNLTTTLFPEVEHGINPLLCPAVVNVHDESLIRFPGSVSLNVHASVLADYVVVRLMYGMLPNGKGELAYVRIEPKKLVRSLALRAAKTKL